jgi:acyl-ACP thioesterase
MTALEHSAIWTEEIRLHSYDVDFKHQATLEAVCRLFLEAAWNHAEHLGVGFHHLSLQQRFWVLSRLTIQIDAIPRWGDQVSLATWPRGASSLFAFRDFVLEDANRQRLVAGSSAWLVLSASSKRPQRLDKLTASIRGLPRKMALNADPEKLPALVGGNLQATATAHYSFIDVNSHVNSARYVGWLLDAYSLDFHRRHSLRRLEINYLGETLAGEVISLFTTETSPGNFFHSIRKADGQEVCRARILWENSTGG